jgi:hypothetical protein
MAFFTSALAGSGELHAPVALPLGNIPLPIVKETVCAPEPVRTSQSKDKSLLPGTQPLA